LPIRSGSGSSSAGLLTRDTGRQGQCCYGCSPSVSGICRRATPEA
jgi:hypothetical protein